MQDFIAESEITVFCDAEQLRYDFTLGERCMVPSGVQDLKTY